MPVLVKSLLSRHSVPCCRSIPALLPLATHPGRPSGNQSPSAFRTNKESGEPIRNLLPEDSPGEPGSPHPIPSNVFSLGFSSSPENLLVCWGWGRETLLLIMLFSLFFVCLPVHPALDFKK